MRTFRVPDDYRADVDGLRAIAVLSVMIFHARDAALPGGFVGVDIFFVISGYLISKHIAVEVASNRFSLLEFYRRRIRRIVPMMMTVVAATLLASLLIMTPEDARAVAKSAVWSIASMANIHFWRDLDTGYFANSSAELPLLHLWSLGVEEQFYLLWPLLLLLGVRKLRPAMLLGVAAVMAGLSFELAFIGKISYSAYLWHWPLFALFRYGYGEPSLIASITIVAATLLLAWVSFELVERPTRSSTARFFTVALRQFALPAVALLIPSLLVVYAARIGLPLASSDYLKQLERVRETIRAPYTYDWVCQRRRLSVADMADPRCVLGAPGEAAPRALLWGDSNAAHYVPMVREIAAHAGVRFRNLAVDSCPPVFTDPRSYVSARRVNDCLASIALIRTEVERYPVVLISAAWSWYFARSPGFIDDVGAFVRTFSERGQSIVLIGSGPVLAGYDRRCPEKALRVPFRTCPDLSEPLADEVVQVNNRLRALAEFTPNVYYFDANRYLCRNGRCSRQTASGLPRYFDERHLTVPGSTELGLEVLAAEGIPAAFATLRP